MLSAPFHWQRVGVNVSVAVDVVGGDSVKDKCSNHIANVFVVAFAIVVVVVAVPRVCSTHTLTQRHTYSQTQTAKKKIQPTL